MMFLKMMAMNRPTISPSQAIGKGYNRFWHDRHFYRVVKGSRGSKKSKTTAINFIYRLMKYSWANLLVVRRYSNTNKDSTYAELVWAIRRLQVDSLFKLNESMPEITYKPTGQKILFRGFDDALKLTSITVSTGELCWVWVEEAYQLEKPDEFDTLVESIRGKNENTEFFKQITLTFNPWSERHWLKRYFFDPETRKKDVYATTTTYRCNEWLGDDDRERYEDLWRTNPRRARIVCNGNWGVAEGLVFENFEVKDFDIDATIKRVGLTVHGMDFGFRHDPTTLPSSVLDLANKEIWIYGELYELAMRTQQIFNAIKAKGLLNAEIVADNTEGRLITELNAMGIRRIRPCRKGADTILHGINFLQSFKIYIHPSCTNTIDEFNTYCYDRDKEGNWLNKPIDANNHIIDALRYSVEKYSIPQKDTRSVVNTMRKLGFGR
jgi:phage terminase large subunit